MACAISRNIVISCAAEPSGLAFDQPLQRFLLAHHADAAGNALAAGFMAEETGDAQQDAAQIHRVVKQHDHAGTKRGADGARAFKGERRIQLLGRNKGSRPRRPEEPPADLPLPATPPARSMSWRSVVPIATS